MAPARLPAIRKRIHLAKKSSCRFDHLADCCVRIRRHSSDKASFITGASLAVDGGKLAA